MDTVGIRELKEHTSRIVRRVRDEGETIEVTHRGEVVARLVPARRRLADSPSEGAELSDLDRLAAEISAYWPASDDARKAVNEGRREL